MALTIALCDACPSTEVDEMTISLLNIFDSRGLGFVLLEALIEHEVDETGKHLCSKGTVQVLIESRKRS
jgi:neurofibromin 1